MAEKPSIIKLSNEERLELENIQLRITMAEQEMGHLLSARGAWQQRMAARVGMSPEEFSKAYIINLEAGTASLDNAIANPTPKPAKQRSPSKKTPAKKARPKRIRRNKRK